MLEGGGGLEGNKGRVGVCVGGGREVGVCADHSGMRRKGGSDRASYFCYS